MELRNIKSFVKVAEFENFSKAAEALGYAQSTITIQIQQLEEELGVNLFDRIGKKVVLSDKGRSFLLYANQMMKIESEAIETISANCVPKGVLRIGTVESIASSFLSSILEEYFQKYPDVHLELIIGVTLDLYAQLEQGTLDMILLLDRPVYRPSLQNVLSIPSKVLFVASADHPLANTKNISPEQLMQENLLLTEKNCNYRHVFDEWTLSHDLMPKRSQEISSFISILYFLEKNLGVSFLPDYAILPLLQEKNLALFSVEGFEIHMDIQILYHRKKFVSLAMRCFTETVENFFASTFQQENTFRQENI